MSNERVVKTELSPDGTNLVVTKVVEVEVTERFRLVPVEPRTVYIGKLSAREIEILALIADGYTNQQSADELCLSIRTVESHRSNIMGKLGIDNRRDLVSYYRSSYEYNGQD